MRQQTGYTGRIIDKECLDSIGKDYYIKKYEKRKRQYFKGMGDRGQAGWDRPPSHPLPVKGTQKLNHHSTSCFNRAT